MHEAHNGEHALKKLMIPESPLREHMLQLVESAERSCVRDAAFTFATSDDDARALVRDYGSRPEDMIVIPNGTDTHGIGFADREARARLKHRLGLDGQTVALFLASGHRPNLDAAQKLFNIAPDMPDVAFALVGNLAEAYRHTPLPKNVWRVGTVSEEARNVWLQAADVALNPVLYGGGTNLKLLDYFAAGTPVVSTGIGVRGTEVEANRHAVVTPIEGFGEAIRRVAARGEAIEAMVAEARRLAEEKFDWIALSDRLYGEMVRRGLLPS
jgi:glycosyltransferase involved in cell wall biosynthesis